MSLLHLAYSFYDELTPGAREHLITQLLAKGQVHRPNEADTPTSEGMPDDWTRAGYVPVPHKDIGETENHILMILTARYLANQLMYQRNPDGIYDNGRNGSTEEGHERPNCTDLVLDLQARILRDDFSEYNAKNYQEETRWALLNLCTYASGTGSSADPYGSISQGVIAANAAGGDILLLRPGDYHETFTLNKPVTLRASRAGPATVGKP